jgi:hypothetical protein
VKDNPTGLETDSDVALPGYVPDPPSRVAPITPYLTDENSDGIYKPPLAPDQDYPTTDPRPA